MENAKTIISIRSRQGNAYQTAYEAGYQAGLAAAGGRTWIGTQAEYDALGSWDPDTTYIIYSA